MLAFLRLRSRVSEGKAGLSERKGRLTGAACCRQVWPHLPQPESRRAVEVAELFADGLCHEGARSLAETEARQPTGGATYGSSADGSLASVAAKMAVARRIPLPQITSFTAYPLVDRGELRLAQTALLRDIFGNPFQPATLDASWLTWNEGTIVKAASAAYEERSLPSGHLDNARLAVLADMLEEAGCRDAKVLAHLRADGVHARGCFALDLILGKE